MAKRAALIGLTNREEVTIGGSEGGGVALTLVATKTADLSVPRSGRTLPTRKFFCTHFC